MKHKSEQLTYPLPGGAKVELWRNKPRGKYRVCVTLPYGKLIATTDFRFDTIADGIAWGQEEERAANVQHLREQHRKQIRRQVQA